MTDPTPSEKAEALPWFDGHRRRLRVAECIEGDEAPGPILREREASEADLSSLLRALSPEAFARVVEPLLSVAQRLERLEIRTLEVANAELAAEKEAHGRTREELQDAVATAEERANDIAGKLHEERGRREAAEQSLRDAKVLLARWVDGIPPHESTIRWLQETDTPDPTPPVSQPAERCSCTMCELLGTGQPPDPMRAAYEALPEQEKQALDESIDRYVDGLVREAHPNPRIGSSVDSLLLAELQSAARAALERVLTLGAQLRMARMSRQTIVLEREAELDLRRMDERKLAELEAKVKAWEPVVTAVGLAENHCDSYKLEVAITAFDAIPSELRPAEEKADG